MTTPDEHNLELLAAEQIDEFDLSSLDRVATLYAKLDPVPTNLVDRIAFGITLNALHAELAELQRSPGLVGVRADEATANTVTFTSASLTVMVSIAPTSPQAARIDGWIAPEAVREVELRTPTRTLRTHTDADGRFALEDVPRGLVQFTFEQLGDAQRVVTPALEI